MSTLRTHGRQIWTIAVITVVVAVGAVLIWNRFRQDFDTLPKTGSEVATQVATVNGVVITQPMVDRELNVSRLNVTAPLPPLTGDDLTRAEEEALNQLISRQLILQAASRQGFVLDRPYIEKRVDLLFGTYGDEALVAALNEANLSREDLVWWVGEIFTMEEFTIQVIMAGAEPGDRQQVYNEWFNAQRAAAEIETSTNGEATTLSALVGASAPDFTLKTLNGQTASLSDYEGKVVLINFWATWCPSCVTEMPDYEQVYQQYNPDFIVLGVNLQEGTDHVQQYASGLGLTFPVLLDEDGLVTTRQYQVTGMPGSFIVDQTGKIHYRHVGPMSAETLTAKLAELGL